MTERPRQYHWTREHLIDAAMSNWLIDAPRRDLESMIHSQQRAIDRLQTLLREVLAGEVAHVWHDRVADEHCVCLDGPWVVRAEAELET